MRVGDLGAQHVVNPHHRFTNVVTNVPLHSIDELVYGDKLSDYGRRRTVLPEQERVVLM